MNDREFYQSLGICPSCKKNRIMGDEKLCPECRAYHEEATERYRARIGREAWNAMMRVEKNARYARLKASGLCPICGKRKPIVGAVLCRICADKRAATKRRWRALKDDNINAGE